MWDEPRNNHLFTAANLRAAQPLLEMLVTYDLVMALPEGIPTLEANGTGNHTRPDNVFCTSHLSEAINVCSVIHGLRPTGTDHYPILTEISIDPERINPPPKRNYRATNWEKFATHLTNQLDTIPAPTDNIASIVDLEQRLEAVSGTILNSVEACIPTSKPSLFTKRWWTPELDEKIKRVRNLTRTAYAKRQQHSHPIHEQVKNARNELATDIQKAKEDHWLEYLENIDGSNIWNVHKYLISEPSDQFISRIPSLRTNAALPPP